MNNVGIWGNDDWIVGDWVLSGGIGEDCEGNGEIFEDKWWLVISLGFEEIIRVEKIRRRSLIDIFFWWEWESVSGG